MQNVYLFVCFLIWSEDAVKSVPFEPDDSVPRVASSDGLNSNRNVNLMEVWAHSDSVVCLFVSYVFMFPYPRMVAMVQCLQRFTPAPIELNLALPRLYARLRFIRNLKSEQWPSLKTNPVHNYLPPTLTATSIPCMASSIWAHKLECSV